MLTSQSKSHARLLPEVVPAEHSWCSTGEERSKGKGKSGGGKEAEAKSDNTLSAVL